MTAVITGRITMRGNVLNVQSDLVDVRNGSQLWGGQYNRPLADILAVQDEIANEIFEKLRLRLTGEEKKRATKRYTENAEAYQVYLRGRYYWNQGTIAGFKKAIEYFQEAGTKDPKYALALRGARRFVSVSRIVLGRGDSRSESRGAQGHRAGSNPRRGACVARTHQAMARLGLAGGRASSSNRASR